MYWFLFCAGIVLSAVGGYFIYRRKVAIASSLIIGAVWLFIGVSLTECDRGTGQNWIADWINSSVAIGTIGVIIVSLYLANRKIDRSKLLDIEINITKYT